MCTNPLSILNPKRYVRLGSGQPLYLSVPCGHCVDCRRKKQNEWRIRTHFECLDSFSKNWYILFDTLTYSNDYLPHLSRFVSDVDSSVDFACFDSKDIQLFFARLRSKLKRAGFDADKNLRYFLTSEYGSNPGDGKTYRPHYHFFIFANKQIPYVTLSRFISQSWYLGRTDGIPYRTKSYVLNHNLFNDMNVSTIRVVDYVAKYVGKDFGFSKIVRNHLYRLMRSKFPQFDWEMDPDQRKYYNKIKRVVENFHLQSKGFGDLFYQLHDKNDLINKGSFVAVDGNGMPLVFSLTSSMKRKLFYNYYRVDGRVSWELNSDGKRYALCQSKKLVRDLEIKLKTYNLDPSVAFDSIYNQNRLLEYKIDNNSLPELIEFSNFYLNKEGDLRNYASVDREFIHRSIFTLNDYGSKRDGFKRGVVLKHCKEFDLMESDSYIQLEEIKDYMYFDPYVDKVMNQYYMKLNELGNNKLAVECLKTRLKNVQKLIKNGIY